MPDAGRRERACAPKQRRPAEVASRFAEIVDAAARLFAEKGYAATSIQQVADRVGLLKGSLYHYINTKEDLLYAVIQEAHSHTAELGREALAMEGDANEKMAHVVRQHIHGAADNLSKVRVFYTESSALSPARLQEILADRDSYEHSLRQLIRMGQQEGLFAPHLDPTLTAIAILAMLNSVQQWYRPDGERTLDEVSDVFTDLVLRSVAAGDPPVGGGDRPGRPGTRRRPPAAIRSGTR